MEQLVQRIKQALGFQPGTCLVRMGHRTKGGGALVGPGVHLLCVLWVGGPSPKPCWVTLPQGALGRHGG